MKDIAAKKAKKEQEEKEKKEKAFGMDNEKFWIEMECICNNSTKLPSETLTSSGTTELTEKLQKSDKPTPLTSIVKSVQTLRSEFKNVDPNLEHEFYKHALFI